MTFSLAIKSEGGRRQAEGRSPEPLPCAHSPSALRRPPFPLRLGLTLIELLVTIVILVSVLGVVLPAVSPNNESRKIREASRQLTSLFAQAQAQAARDGRPVGVGFTDPDGDGMALEAFIIAEPPVFTGFSSTSAVGIQRLEEADQVDPYVPLNGNQPDLSKAPTPQPPLVNLVFGNGVGGETMVIDDPSDQIPPRMFRGGVFDSDLDGSMDEPGDLVEIGQELFELVENDCDDIDDSDSSPDVETVNDVKYLKPQKVVTARWITWRYRDARLAPHGGKAYRMRRRPSTNLTPSRTTAEAIQFPRGIGIDFDPTDADRALSILFSPTGAIDSVYVDGRKVDHFDDLFILLGRVENGNPPTIEVAPGRFDIDYTLYDFNGVNFDDQGNELLAQRRGELNMLNADSRWVAVSRAGRVVANDNNIFDPRDPVFVEGSGDDMDNSPEAQRRRQRAAAQAYASQFETQGGR